MNQPEDSVRTGLWKPAQSEAPASDPVAAQTPLQIGRYRVERILGEGGFGRVYLARDDIEGLPQANKELGESKPR